MAEISSRVNLANALTMLRVNVAGVLEEVFPYERSESKELFGSKLFW